MWIRIIRHGKRLSKKEITYQRKSNISWRALFIISTKENLEDFQ